MTRQRLRAALTILIVTVCFLTGVAVLRSHQSDAQPGKPSTADAIAILLKPTDKLKDGFEANTPLDVALDFVGKTHGLQFKFDEESFKQNGEGQIAKKAVNFAGKKGLPLAELLKELLDHAAEQRTGFYVRDGIIIVATMEWAFLATGCDMAQILNPDTVVRFLHCKERPLHEVLVELGERHGRSVVFDPRLGDKAKTPVSVTLQFATVNSVVRLLANMADLHAVPLDNILYITSRENAKRLQSELAEPVRPVGP